MSVNSCRLRFVFGRALLTLRHVFLARLPDHRRAAAISASPIHPLSVSSSMVTAIVFKLWQNFRVCRLPSRHGLAAISLGETLTMGHRVETKRAVLDALSRSRDQLRELGVEQIGLFGSFVRDEPRSDSDVDVIVRFDPRRKTFDNFMQLSMLLEDLLGRRVEVVTTEALSPYIGPHILREVEYVDLAA